MKIIGKVFVIIFVILFFLSFGCEKKVIIMDQKEVFFRNNPELSEKYINFSITSFDSRDKHLDDCFVLTTTMLAIVLNKHKDVNGLPETIEGMIDRYKIDYLNEKKNYLGMSRSNVICGDSLYLYQMKDNGLTENGLIVLNNGVIREKYIDYIFRDTSTVTDNLKVP